MKVDFYIHPKCCGKRWELAIIKGQYRLLCGECGKDSGLEFLSEPPELSQCHLCGDHKLKEVPEEKKKEIMEAAKKGIEFAPQIGVDQYDNIAKVFLREVFDQEGALITDESSLYDFMDLFEDRNPKKHLEKIQKLYDVDVSDIEGLNLVQIFERLRILSPRFI